MRRRRRRVSALREIIEGVASAEEVTRRYGANALTSLKNLGLRDERCRVQPELRESTLDAAEQVRGRALASPTLTLVRELVAEKPGIGGVDIGVAVAERFGLVWSKASKLRCGSALKRWARWAEARARLEELTLV